MANLVMNEVRKPNNDWVREGDTLFPCNGKVAVTDTIDPGIYRVVPAPNPMDSRLGIRFISDRFDLGVKKIYSTGGEEIQEVIKKTWDDYRFQTLNSNLCTILSGIKGTGKTITAKQLCNYYVSRYPVLIIDSAFNGKIVDFVQSLDFKCVLLIDEAEKTFLEDRTALLKVCDGAMNMSPKIVLMTMNDLNVDRNLISRPGRVRYIKEFGNLPESTCAELLKDKLENKELVPKILDFLCMLDTITIDIVQSIVDEVNIYGDLSTVKKFMNINTASIDTYYVIGTGFTEEEERALVNYCSGYEGYAVTSLFSYSSCEWEKYPSDIKKLLSKRNLGNLSELNRGANKYINSGETPNIGILKFEVGTIIPGVGKITESLGDNWYHVEIDVSTDEHICSEYDEGDWYEFNKCEFLLDPLRNCHSLNTGDQLLVYMKSRQPLALYKKLTI